MSVSGRAGRSVEPGVGVETGTETGTEIAAKVRPAGAEDLSAFAAAVGELLTELGSTLPPESEMLAAATALHKDPSSGALLVAEAEDRSEGQGAGAGGSIVGVLAASFQVALHVPGRYAVVQDLWVAPAWRSRSVGHELVDALCLLAAEEGMSRVEVGLPRESFHNIDATESFYLRNGFTHLGPRMRRVCA